MDVLTDVVVLGSGGAGLVAALTAAHGGLSVILLERTDRFGGTTAVSGGMVWVPCNPHMAEIGIEDSREDAIAYMAACAGGAVPASMIEAYVDGSAAMVRFLESSSPARFVAVPRPDYRPEWPGGRPGGRTLDNRPFPLDRLAGLPLRPRRNAMPLIHEELVASRYAARERGIDRAAVDERIANNIVTMGNALAGSLLAGCAEAGVDLRTGCRARSLIEEDGRIVGVRVETADGPDELRARRGVVVATGGFEWNEVMRKAFVGRPLELPVSPPWNEGDGIAMGQRAGAGLGNMTEAWWVPTYSIPGETYDGRTLARHLGSELSLPGSILVNRRGERFVNESVNYNDLSSAFAVRDANGAELANVPCWVVFDEAYRQRYIVSGSSPSGTVPHWWTTAPTVPALADALGIDRDGLARTVDEFGLAARAGVDARFGRGDSAHDRFYGDPDVSPNSCLAPLEQAPFHAFPVHPGAFGTKGGLAIDERSRVLRFDGSPIPGLYAAGNTSSGVTGPGYPGAGATLGAAMTFGFIAGRDLVSLPVP